LGFAGSGSFARGIGAWIEGMEMPEEYVELD